MAKPWKDRIKVASSTTGTGTLTLGAAAAGYQTFAAGDDGLRFDIGIEDGTAWETALDCLYTHSGTTLTRGIFSSSSTGSVLSLSGAENVFVDLVAGRLTSDELAIQTYIVGLIVTKNTGGNTLDISAGSCYDPSSNKIINYAGATGITPPALGNSQWNQCYIYDNAGTTTIEIVNNANPPSTTYAGTARQGGTNSNRRWIGSFLTTAAGAIYTQDVKETGNGAAVTMWLTNPGSTPFRVVSAGTAVAYGSETSCVGCIPRYVANEMLVHISLTYATTGAATLRIDFAIDATNLQVSTHQWIPFANTIMSIAVWVPLASSTPGVSYMMAVSSPGVAPNAYIDVCGYRWTR